MFSHKARTLAALAAMTLSLVMSARFAEAGPLSVSYSGSVPVQLTDWNSSINIPQLDPSLYVSNPSNLTLDSVTIEFGGTVLGSVAFENLDNNPADVTMELSATISLTDPFSLLNLFSLTPSVVYNELGVGAYDGVDDFGGVSGRTVNGLSDSASSSTTLLSGLAAFIGNGNIAFPVAAVGTSQGSASGNIAQEFDTNATAELRVTYNFTVVPEPSSIALAGIGLVALGGLGLRARRRR